jgi:hypothetical protein
VALPGSRFLRRGRAQLATAVVADAGKGGTGVGRRGPTCVLSNEAKEAPTETDGM